jgi:spore coat polysaccharide biosynthesis protein SpsF
MGAELTTLNALERCSALTDEDSAHEHVTLYMRNHPELFNVLKLDAPHSRRNTSVHVTVDYPQDLEFVREICRRYCRPGNIDTEDILELVKQNPGLLSTNAGLHEPYSEALYSKISEEKEGTS